MDQVGIPEAITPIALVEKILHEAERLDASDIHIDPYEATVSIRFRADGLLRTYSHLPKQAHAGLISRLKILAHLRTDLHHLPQDGRLHKAYRDSRSDIRISIIPTYYGESVVLRLLKDKPDFIHLERLGFSKEDGKKLAAAVNRRRGMILTTGPTGSGKTTTLYSLLHLVAPERLIITIEDPIEYVLKGARQVQVDAAHGLTFAAGLRSMLRQDPDVIMIGEIRDSETAQIAIHAALTGHLLFSTLHTNDALSVVVRLLDMGIAPYLIAATLETVIAQRLVRKRCQECHLQEGCKACNYSGFSGRLAVYEIVTISETLRAAITAQASLEELRLKAQHEEIRSLLVDGIQKAQQGLVDRAEVMSSL